MAWFIGQSLTMIVLAFVLGLVVGWLIWGRIAISLRREVADLRRQLAETPPAASVPEQSPKKSPERVPTTAVAAPEATTGADATEPEAKPEVKPATETGAPVHIPAPRGETSVSNVAGAIGLADELDAPPAREPQAEVNGVAVSPETLAATGAVEAFEDDDAYDEDALADVHALDEADDDGEVDAQLAAVEAVAAQPAVDKLDRIEGIGPKFSAALVSAGIRTYDQLAAADEATLRAAIENAGYDFAPSIPTWARQAKLLADGDEAGFAELTARLIAGRDTGPKKTAEEPPEDLARIEGIGPRFAAALVAAGIRTFAQLAAADEATLRKALTDANLRFAPSLTTWAQQAKLLADGDENGFAELTARLIAGRNVTDDLARIEGIGPKVAAALKAAGIHTYRALANANNAKLKRALEAAGISFAPSLTTWSRQARLLADGDEEGFADLTRRLIAGRDEGRA